MFCAVISSNTSFSLRLYVQALARRLGRKPPTEQKLDLSNKRGRLASRIAEHQIRANRYLLAGGDPDQYDFDTEGVFYEDEEGQISLGYPDPFTSPDTAAVPERFKLTLPSSLSRDVRTARRLTLATEKEIQLRVGQCNDALQGVRLALGKKAFLFRTQIREKGPKTGKTKSWDSIHHTDDSLRENAQIYRLARAALETLDAGPDILMKYQALDPKHLKTSTTLLDDSIHRQKHDHLPWFWYLDVAGDVTAAEQMLECEFATPLPLIILRSFTIQSTASIGFGPRPILNVQRKSSSW